MIKQWFQHAFAVNDTPNEPAPEQLAVMEKLCREVIRRQLTTPAIAFLEMSRPLNYIGSQTLHFFSPLISAIAQGDDHLHLATFLERRDSIDRICRRVEELEQSVAAKDDKQSAADAPSDPPNAAG